MTIWCGGGLGAHDSRIGSASCLHSSSVMVMKSVISEVPRWSKPDHERQTRGRLLVSSKQHSDAPGAKEPRCASRRARSTIGSAGPWRATNTVVACFIRDVPGVLIRDGDASKHARLGTGHAHLQPQQAREQRGARVNSTLNTQLISVVISP